jgi:hypothetical protein
MVSLEWMMHNVGGYSCRVYVWNKILCIPVHEPTL